jgi:hypothetical protein
MMETEDLVPICQYCDRIIKCRHLGDDAGKFVLERVVTRENFRACPDWAPVGHLQKPVRDRLYNYSGTGYLRTLYELPELILDGVRQGEMDELMLEDIPDFRSLLYQGINTTQREEQLRYEHDEQGGIIAINEDGNEVCRARPVYQLLAYAADPEGPVKANKQKILFYSTNEAIDLILRAEVDQGLVIKDKKPKAPTISERPQPVEAGRETEAMPTQAPAGRRVRVQKTTAPATQAARPAAAAQPGAPARRVSAKPPAAVQAVAAQPTRLPSPVSGARPPMAGPGRVARPPVRTGAPVTQAAPAQQAAPESPPQELDVEGLAIKVANLLKPMFEEVLASAAEARSTLMDAIAIHFDMATKTGGTYQFPKTQAVVDEQGNIQTDEAGNALTEPLVDEAGNQIFEPLPCIFNKPAKILGFVDDSAYEPDPEQPAGE